MRDGPGQFGQGYIGGIVRGEVVAQSVRSCITVDPALGLVVQASLAAWLITAATTAGRETKRGDSKPFTIMVNPRAAS